MSEALIVRHCSPTLAGLKTANMFNYDFVDRAELMESIRSVNALLLHSLYRVRERGLLEARLHRPAVTALFNARSFRVSPDTLRAL